MKTKFTLLCLLSFVFYLGTAQVPQGFNYQAAARTTAGEPLVNLTNLQVMLYIQSSPTGGTIFWKELHNPVSTNSLGVFTVVLGTGVPQTGRTVSSFNLIDWSVTPKYIKTEIYYSGGWKDMGTATQLWTVPYSMTAQNAMSAKSINADSVDIKGTTTNMNGALFEVKNKDDQTVFAVYNEGVRIWVADGAKGSRGGFAVGGFDQTKTWNQEYLRVTSDSTRIYVNSDATKGSRGGFAVGGFDAAKANTITTFTSLTPQNYFIGHESGLKTDPKQGGLYNSFFGFQTGRANVKGASNVFLGYQSGMANTASSNVFIGFQSGLANTSGFNNIFLGYKAGYSNTIGDNNVFIGSNSGYNSIGGSVRGDGNVFIGYYSGYENLTGVGNSYIGYQAGYKSQGKWNAFLGYRAGYNNTDGNYNVYIGPYAGQGSSTVTVNATNNVFLGNYAGEGVSTGSYNAILGFQSGRGLSTGQGNVFLGYKAGYYNDTASYNVFLGKESGYNNKGTFNSFIGYQSGLSNTSGSYNAFVGYQAGYGNTSGDYNTLLGYQAGFHSGGSSYITAIGYLAGYSLTDWQAGTYVGYRAGQFNTGRTNVMIGSSAGYTVSTGEDNVIIGGGAGGDSDGSTDRFTGSRNVMIGKYAGFKFGAGSNNIYLGPSAGSGATGTGNIFIGYSAGQNNTGSGLLIVDNAGGGETNALIYGNFNSNQLRFNGTVGVNTAPGAAKLSVVDDAATIAVRGETSWSGTGTHYGLYGYGTGGTSFNEGVYGRAAGGTQSFGIYGTASGATDYTIGVFGTSSIATGHYAGYFSGDLAYTGGIYDVSDKNFKKDIEAISGALGMILKINGISYKFKSGNDLSILSGSSSAEPGDETPSVYNLPSGKQFGVIAQDVEMVLPELVKTNPDGYKMVDYVKFVPVLIEAVKEQQKMIDELKAEIEELKKK